MDRKQALIAMHLYEALAEYEDEGMDSHGRARRLMDAIYDEWSDAWIELGPMINRD